MRAAAERWDVGLNRGESLNDLCPTLHRRKCTEGRGRKREEEGRENMYSRRRYRDQRKNKTGPKGIPYTGPINDENSIHSDRNWGSTYSIDAEKKLMFSLNCNSSEKSL